MSDLDNKIEEIKEKIYELQKDLAVIMRDAAKSKWEPKGGQWFINQPDDEVEYWKMSNVDTRDAGLERPTQEQAERAAVEMRKFNRLLALRDELCGDEVVDWSGASTCKYTIEFIVDENRWDVDPTCIYHKITIYFTTIKHAQRACDMLNSGEVEL